MLHARPRCGTGWVVALVLLALTSARPATAQTVTTGFLTGSVRDPGGVALFDVRVAAENVRTGSTRSVRTDRDGDYALRFLPAGEYRVRAEKLGFQPQVVEGVILPPGRSLELSFVIEPAEPPVETVDSLDFAAAAFGLARSAGGRWLGALERGVARERSELPAIARLATPVTDPFVIQGLPAVYSRFVLDGSAYRPLLHPHLLQAPLSPRPLAALESAELDVSPLDVQWGDAAAGLLTGHGRQSTRAFSARVAASGTQQDFALGRFTDPVLGGYDMYRAAAEVTGPVIGDTAYYAIGGEWRRVRWLDPAVWRADQLSGESIASIARDSAGTDIRFYALPQTRESDVMSGYARFDWLVAEAHQVAFHADLSAYPSADGWPRAPSAESLALTTPGGFDLAAGLVVRSALTERYGNEVRFGFHRAEHEHSPPERNAEADLPGTRVPLTSVLTDAIAFGLDPRLPATFEQTGFEGEQVLSVLLGAHRLKVGVTAEWDSYDRLYAFGRPGMFTFADPDAFAARRGRFVQTTGTVPAASFSVLETGLLLQDDWQVAPGLRLIGGLRVSEERLPTDAISPQTEWQRLTGLENQRIDDRLRQWSPRVGFAWDVRQDHRWTVHGGFAVHHDDAGPDVLAELASLDGAVRVRRGWGDLGRWPTAPDSIAAPVQGPTLSLLAPEFAAPRTSRASFGFSRLGLTSFHVSATYRHTDFLPQRRDINLIGSPGAVDQHGRPIFGTLVQDGALIGAEPGSNRRFASFDVVSAIEPTAFSDYWDFTASLERRLGASLNLAASYTFSRTEDDWLSHPGISPMEGFAPVGIETAIGSPWDAATSDFDVPHRASVAAELRLPLSIDAALSAAWRYHSGLPFTPGFRDGVDVNGDYSASNDPAFVDDAIPGIPELVESFECLRDQVGRFAERNACRGDGRNWLDLRLTAAVGGPGSFGATLFVDALNLLDSGIGLPDRALYLIDEDTDLLVDDAAGTVTIPLVANPQFGRPLRDIGTGRVFRLGMEMTF